MRPVPVFLVGFMAAGKTTVGRLLAERLGLPFVDLDDIVSETAGLPVREIFAQHGEEEFRRREAQSLARLVAGPPAVVATGGGTPCHGSNLDLMRRAGLVVALAVPLDVARLRAGDPGIRPLLDQPAEEIAGLFRVRQPFYRQAHVHLVTTAHTPDEVAELAAAACRSLTDLLDDALLAGSVAVSLGDRSYPIAIGRGSLARLGAIARASLPSACARVALVSDGNVDPLHGGAAATSLEQAGFEVARAVVPAGEASKSLDSFGALQELLVAAGLDRTSAIVALGGGVVGDLAGFAAATLFRGVPCLQVPTTLLAMIDSAIGGKTAIDLEAGKNLVGAFWQPTAVLVDPDLLATLPPRELRAAFGELVKYALLDGEELYAAVDRLAPTVAGDVAPDLEAMTPLIRRAAAFKAGIVAADEREQGGERAILNLGHTVGHAIEAAAGYGPDGLLHGEAVALGLRAACRVSAVLGDAEAGLEERVAATLARAGLPTDLDRWLRPDVLARIGVDKKRTGARIRFITVDRPGVIRPAFLDLDRLGEILAAP